MRRLDYVVAPDEAGLSVAELLAARGYSRRLVVALKQTPEGLTLDGARVRSSRRLAAGECLTVTLPDQAPALRQVLEAPPVLYEDDDLIVYDKPAGLVCHRSGGHIGDTLESAFSFGAFRAVFRLDRDTSGALLVAKHQLAAGRLWRAVEKRYLAVVGGCPSPAEGVVDLPLARERPYEPRQIVSPEGKRAVTHYRVVERTASGDRSLVECRLETGRMHQIRVHMAALGHPLLGDAFYGGDGAAVDRQALHCAELRFAQPVTGQPLVVSSPLPEALRGLLREG